MDNHIHLVVIPETEKGLQKGLKPLHMRYANILINTMAGPAIYGKGDFFISMG
jgi:hypothetical protein